MLKYIVSQPAITLCIESRSSRSPTTTSAPMSRNACARSSSFRTIARTALRCCNSSWVTVRPIAPTRPAAPVTRMELGMFFPPIRFTDSAPACMRSGSFRPVSGLPVGEVLGNSGAREPLTQQTGKEQQRAAWPVTRHDVLGLPGGVIGDQDDTADRLAVDLSYVVLEEAVVTVRASELVLLAVIQRADSDHH